MMGTARNIVTLASLSSLSITGTTSFFPNRQQAPENIHWRKTAVIVYAWWMGNTAYTTSVGYSVMYLSILKASDTKLVCVSTTPLGFPVVPEVKRMAAVSSESTLAIVHFSPFMSNIYGKTSPHSRDILNSKFGALTWILSSSANIPLTSPKSRSLSNSSFLRP